MLRLLLQQRSQQNGAIKTNPLWKKKSWQTLWVYSEDTLMQSLGFSCIGATTGGKTKAMDLKNYHMLECIPGKKKWKKYNIRNKDHLDFCEVCAMFVNVSVFCYIIHPSFIRYPLLPLRVRGVTSSSRVGLAIGSIVTFPSGLVTSLGWRRQWGKKSKTV